jgi:putative membrane protein
MNELRAVGDENPKSDKLVVPIIVILSIVVPLAVAALLLFPDVFKLELGLSRGTLPAFHAILNGTTAVLLLSGLYFIS